MPRTYAAKPDYAVKFWKERGFRPRRVDILAVVRERASRYYGYHIPQVYGKVIRGDSRVITIPSVERLIIRFGGIHDRKANPREIMKDSLRLADSHWRLRTVRSAGCSTAGKRQANQFVRSPKHPIEEFDFYARLE